jgi:hypothetical protein
MKPYVKIKFKKRVGDVAYLIECLPGKRKAFSSNSNTSKKNHNEHEAV